MQSQKRNILFLSSWYPNRVQPTLGNFIQKHAEAVALQSNVAALNVCSDSNCIEKFEATTHTTKNVFTVNVYYKKTSNPFAKIIRYLKAHKVGMNIIDEHFSKIDIVHVNKLFPVGYFALQLKKKRNIPYIITEHWTGYLPSKKENIGAFEIKISKLIIANASTITTVSNDLKNAMQQLGFNNKYKVVYNVVDTSLFSPPTNKTSNGKIKFLHISHLDDAHKNISGMLRVAQLLAQSVTDFEFWLVGDGDTKPHELYAKELTILNSFAFFSGTQSTEQVAELMKQSDCFVLFSNYENMPVVISEAMACGLPVISSNVGGISEHITNKNGKLVEAKNENELLHCLSNMIIDLKNNSYNSAEISNYAHKNFSYEKVCKQFHEIYNEVLLLK